MTDTGSSRAIGLAAESQAQGYLERQGLKLLTRNYRCPHGELDLIMTDGRSTVFVEVRLRRNRRFGSGADSIDARKQGKLTAAALHYLQRHPVQAQRPARFDVISIGAGDNDAAIDWITDAFGI